MTGVPSEPSMFDYDARPVTPQIVLVGTGASPVGYAIRDFLSRNGFPYEWVNVEDRVRVESVLGTADVAVDRLPVCVLPDGTQLAPASVQVVAAGLGMVAPPLLASYDLTIVGAGPAGLAASVYAASEGLRTLAIEAIAPGGQAGTTSLIENYLGFPQGISGSELAVRATAQARRFGAQILLARTLSGIVRDGSAYAVELSDGTAVHSRAVLLATGVEWRRLEVPGVEELLGAGVYYGAAPSEAVTCRGCRVAIVGGGNSAGQAAVRFSRYASQVTLLVRGSDVGASMSQYLVDRVRALENVNVQESTRIVGLESDVRLRGLMLATRNDDDAVTTERVAIDSLFICIGGEPRTEGAAKVGLATDKEGYLRTGTDVDATPASLDGWPLARPPLPLETNLPGLFAAGDVRSGSIKRCSAAIGEGAMAVALAHQRLAELSGE
jgi:thioredoxin reductase (NADPH)